MTSNQTRYKAEKGEYTLVDPLDYMILGFLPETGQLAFGLYPLGETVPALKKKFTPDQQKHLSSSVLGGRLVALGVQGLAVNSSGRSGDRKIWQRTKLGTSVLNKWEGTNSGSGNKKPGTSS